MTKVPKITPIKHNGEWYQTIGFLVGIISFIGVWIYAIGQWGFLLGITLGWIPGLIAGAIAGFLWPLGALALIVWLFLILLSLR